MYLIVIAWTYVTLMMAVAEATSSTGTVLGALITFVLYGMLPMGILIYILGTPTRKRAIRAREAAEQAAYDAQQREHAAQGTQAAPGDGKPLSLPPESTSGGPSSPGAGPGAVAPDAGGKPPAAAEGAAVAPVRKED